MGELTANQSQISIRRWGPHCFAAFIFDRYTSTLGDGIGVFDTRREAEQAARDRLVVRRRNRGTTTKAAAKITTAERTSTAGVCENDCGPATEIADPQRPHSCYPQERSRS